MKINVTNSQKIESALEAVNGRAVAHTLRHRCQILDITRRAEKDLSQRGLPKKLWGGTRITFRPAGPGKAYARKGKFVVSTHVTIERGASAWFLVDCKRVEIWSDESECYQIAIDQAQLDAMQGAVFADFEVVTSLKN